MKHTLLLSFGLLFAACGLRAQYTIPVVFHVLHAGGFENITDAQVLDAVRLLNLDFNKQNADTANIVPQFKSIAANMNITFKLATIDPYGNCTNGIEHLYTTQTYVANDLSKVHDWPRNKYLNIWTVKKMEGGAAAYAYWPWTVIDSEEIDGVIILNNYIGSVGTGSVLTSRGLTKEVGQYLGLMNPGSYTISSGPQEICNDDSVYDTPPADFSTPYNACQHPDSVYSAACGGDLVNVQNFMAYNNCTCMFTNGQRDRVYQYLNRDACGRNNLWSIGNLAATGTNGNASPCAPICDFSVNQRFVCVGQPVIFKDNSYNSTITQRNWSFPNANPTSSTDSIVTVTFTHTGWQTVKLVVSNNYGADSVSQTLVYVADNTMFTAPYYNGFEDAADFNANWISINYDNDQPHFQRSTNIGHTSNASIIYDNYHSTVDHSLDELITPAFDLSHLSPADMELWFTYSLATRSLTTFTSDSLALFYSKDCGTTWSSLYHLSGASGHFVNVANEPAFFNGNANESYWHTVYTTLPGNLNISNVRFKFQMFGTHNGNNLYIDDFIIGPQTTGANNIARNLSFRLVPNPSKDVATVTGLSDKPYTLSLCDLMGREIITNKVEPVNGMLEININNIIPGIYIVKLTDGQTTGEAKLVKQ